MSSKGMLRILRLPAETISQIHSSRNITSLQGVVLALLENSLDAEARKVEISVDFRRGDCTVEDDGDGIPTAEFRDAGGLGKMFHTSKRSGLGQNEVHGSTGTYLASLSALSLLQITSTHASHDYESTLTIHHSKVIGRKASKVAGNEMLTTAPGAGTCVTVRDLFGNMPVRVKQRALQEDEGIHDERAWLELKRGVVALLLAWRQPCAIRMREVRVESRYLQLSSMQSAGNQALTRRSLNSLAGHIPNFGVSDVLPILSQAGLAPTESRSGWVPVSASTLKLGVKGAICIEPVPTKQCQFISLGVRPLLANDLYEAVNRSFSNSSFGSLDDDEQIDEGEKDRRNRDRRYKNDGYTQKQLHGRKGVDRWPMFVLEINFVDQQTRSPEPDGMSEASLRTVIEVLEAMITQWLTANHFRSRKPRRRKRPSVDSPSEDLSQPALVSQQIRTPTSGLSHTLRSATTSKKRKYVDMTGQTHIVEASPLTDTPNQNSYFSSWSRIKSGRDTFYDAGHSAKKPATAQAGQTGTRVEKESEESRHMFSLPDLEVGELNRVSTPSDIRPFIRAEPVNEPKRTSGFDINDNPSSEDFGSFDEGAALDAINEIHRAVEAPFSHTENNSPVIVSPPEGLLANDSIVDWTDPITKQSFQVNARTGVVLPSRSHSARSTVDGRLEPHLGQRHSAAINTLLSSAGKSLSLVRRPKTSRSQDSRWLPGFLKQWDNPVFAQQDEKAIPQSFLQADPRANGAQTSHNCLNNTMNYSQSHVPALTKNLSKAALRDSIVIKQVDQKYMLCKTGTVVGSDSEAKLILIDQHAASERVILEGLLSELCTPVMPTVEHSHAKVKTVSLEKPLRFEISGSDYALFKKHRQHFANWGIIYTLNEREEVLGTSQVRAPKREYVIVVQHLPPAIAERCTLVPKLLIELLRSEIWTLAERAHQSKITPSDHAHDYKMADEEHGWLQRLYDCPKGILDMLSSRACRSAIMFNDELLITQCEQLVSDLSQCAFPFICAHGRVSMVPLAEPAMIFGALPERPLCDTKDTAPASYKRAYYEWKATNSSVDRTNSINIKDQ